MKLFVFGTLKNPRTRAAAIGREEKAHKAVLPGYVLSHAEIDGETYPTLIKAAPDRYVLGDVIDVNPHELVKADTWEEKHYDLREVTTSAGDAWAYFYRGVK